MKSVFEAVTDFFKQDNWHIEKHGDETAFYTNFGGEHGQWRCYGETRESPAQFVFYSLCPIHIPELKRQDISEFLTRANFDLVIGNFEFDLEDGEIRFKTSIDVEGSHLDFNLIKRLVYTNAVMMDQYLPGITAVAYGAVTPLEAIAKIENEV